MYLALTTRLGQGWPSNSSSTTSGFSSSSSFSSNCEDRVATANLNSCETSISAADNHTPNPTNSPVTVTRKEAEHSTSDLILNDVLQLSTDPNHYNVHDNALFNQPTLLPQWWFAQLRHREVKPVSPGNSSSILWAKVRAVTYMTTLAHRAGSWYSDDRTEKSLGENGDDEDNDVTEAPPSEGEGEEKDPLGTLDLIDIQLDQKSDLSVPLRRSLSSIEYVKHKDDYSSRLSRSRSTTLISSRELCMNSLPVDPPVPPASPSTAPAPAPSSPPTSSSRVYRFLHCIIL